MFNNNLNFQKRYCLYVFLGVFIISFILFCIRWDKFILIDSSLWGNQSMYFLQEDLKEFDFLAGYGHPGGPIIEGTILINKLFNINYERSAIFFVITIISIFISSICILCILLKKDKLWWIAVLPFLLFNWLYEYGTPPSIISTVIVTFLCLFTLYIYESKQKKTLPLILFGIVAGLSIATRADMGIFSFVVFLFILFKKINWKEILVIITSSVLSFIIFNPFMWFMPIQHTKDLIFKLTYHYFDFAKNYLSLSSIVSLSLIAFISIIISVYYLTKNEDTNPSPVPKYFLWILIIMTICLYFIFLSSHYQAERYFLPIIFIWQTLFPLLLFSIMDKLKNNSKQNIKIYFIILFAIFNIAILIQVPPFNFHQLL